MIMYSKLERLAYRPASPPKDSSPLLSASPRTWTSAEPNITRGEQVKCRFLSYSSFLTSFLARGECHGVETRFAFAELARAEEMRSFSSLATSFTIVALSFSALVQAGIPVTITNRCNHDL